MPIKLNSTTIFDESNFADKDLSNLSESGTQVINNAVSSAISGIDYMKHIDTKNGVSFNVSRNTSYTTPSNGWILILCNTGLKIGGTEIIIPSGSSLLHYSFPVISGTVLSTTESGASTGIFFPEIS